MSSRSYLSIGDVLTLLREEFPDVTISKIRFLESQGLVNPERSPSGYRKFFETDVERLRWVLRQQREHFLPLKVIRDRLADGDLYEEGSEEGSDATSEADVAPASEDPAALRRNGRVREPAHAAAGAARSAGATSSGLGPAAGRTEERASKADDEAMARILADASRRAARSPDAVAAAVPTTGAPVAGNVGASAPPRPTVTTPQASAAGAHTSPEPGPTTTAALAASAGRATPPPSGAQSAPSAPRPHEAAGASSTAGAAGGPSTGDRGVRGARAADKGRPVAAAPTAARGVRPEGDTAAGAGSSTGGRHAVTGGAPTSESPPAAASIAASPSTADEGSAAGVTADELCAASGLSEVELAGLQGFGLIECVVVAGIPTFDEDAVTVANLAAEFRKFGIEPRHLRLYRNSVDRELGLIEQVIIPLLRQRNPESRRRAIEGADELGALGQSMRGALLRTALRRHLGS